MGFLRSKDTYQSFSGTVGHILHIPFKKLYRVPHSPIPYEATLHNRGLEIRLPFRIFRLRPAVRAAEAKHPVLPQLHERVPRHGLTEFRSQGCLGGFVNLLNPKP